MYCWVNGKIIAEHQASISIADRGFLYGETIFETMRACAGQIPLLVHHLQRLQQTVEQLGFTLLYSPAEITDACYALLAMNNMTEGILRLTLSNGQSQRGIDSRYTKLPVFLITCCALPENIKTRAIEGYRLALSTWRKPSALSFPTFAKTGNYLNSVLAYRSIADQADEALLLDEQEYVAEGSFTNIFFVIKGQLLTPSLPRCLPGIARQLVLNYACELNIQTKQLDIFLEQLIHVEEIFLTNAVRGIMPVSCFQQKVFDVPGAVTAKLMRVWDTKDYKA